MPLPVSRHERGRKRIEVREIVVEGRPAVHDDEQCNYRAERDQIMEIATLLLPWCRDGNYGCLFDGVSNLSLTGRIAHFELGYIPESAKELKAAAKACAAREQWVLTLP